MTSTLLAAVLAAGLAATAPPEPAKASATQTAGAHPRRHGRAVPLATASPLETPPAAPPRKRGEGRVIGLTAGRAYLDAGAEEGLAPGARLVLRRNEEPAGACVLDLVAAHHASCPAAPGLKVGDAFALGAAAEPPAPKLLPDPPAPEELDRRRALLADAPAALVEWKPPEGKAALVSRARSVEAGLTHASWTSSTSSSSTRESVDVILRGVEAGGGLTLDVDARAERWLHRDQPRFRPNADTQLYVWQAQLSGAPGPFVFSAGRVLPWTVPGATLFDGATGGVRGKLGDYRAEGGVFGGFVPDPQTTAPTSKRYTGGGYWSLDRALAPGANLRQEGRLAVVHSPELGTRAEGSVALRLFLRVFDLSAEANGGGGGSARGGLDSGRVDAGFRPVKGVALGGSFRQSNLAWPQTAEPATWPGRSRAADGYLYVDAATWLRLGATGGTSRDLANHLERRWFGPELALPRLLGSRGGLVVGYLEESGWLAGRSAYVQLAARPWDPLRLVARASWARERSLGQDRDDVGLALAANADLTAHLGLRLSVLGRTGLNLSAGEGGASAPLGVTGFATLYGAW